MTYTFSVTVYVRSDKIDVFPLSIKADDIESAIDRIKPVIVGHYGRDMKFEVRQTKEDGIL